MNDHLWIGHDVPPDPNRRIDHQAAIETSGFLTEVFFSMNRPEAARVHPNQLIEILNAAKVRFVLMGAHGIAGWLHEPRSTRDVDVVVAKRHHKKAVRAIQEAFPTLIPEEHPVVTRFRDPADQQVVIDVMRPIDLYSQVFENTISVGKTHQAPSLEMALAGKYAAMITLTRERRKRLLDMADFVSIVQGHYQKIDKQLLHLLGDFVYEGGGKELQRFVEDAQAGRNLPA